MSSDKSLTWYDDSSSLGGCWAGGFCSLVVGVFPLALLTKVWSVLPEAWYGYLATAVVLVGAGVGVLVGRHEVHTVTLTAHRAELVSHVATHVVDIAELTEVSVEHSGNTDDGYVRSSLLLLTAGGRRANVSGGYDPGLAARIGRVLGARLTVEETHRELDPPV